MMSSGLAKVNATARDTFKKVQSYVDETIKKNKKLADSYDEIDNKVKRSGSSIGGWARQLGIAISAAGILSFASGSVKAAMDFGATKTSYGVLTGSKQKGNDLANTLNTLQQNTILGPEVFKAAQTMMSFGVATEKVVDVTKQLGDVSMGNKDRFSALTLAYSQTQAAGKLMGQDLLQYVNAGFNPLQTMAEKWKEFGFQQKKSVADLRAMMEKGEISAVMVAKAFELATSKGGKFNNMMDQIAQTSYGKMQILAGQYEAFKINLGDAMMPVAESMMKAGNNLLNFLNLSKTAPQILSQERGELNSLLRVITNLNEGNELRRSLLQQLNTKYPDLFKNIDIEKVKNNELLTMLNDINNAYDKRIGFATSDLIMGNAKTAAEEAQANYTKYMTLVELMNRGDKDAAHNLRSYSDAFNASKPFTDEKEYYQKQADHYKEILDLQNKVISNEKEIKSQRTMIAIAEDAYNLYRAPTSKRAEVFGKDKKREEEFDKIAGSIHQKANGQWKVYGGVPGGVFNRLRALMDGVPAGSTDKVTTGGDKSTASSITSGGPRVINIYGVKFMDKLELHTATFKEGVDEMQDALENMLLRLLNSGAAVQ